MSLRTKTCLAFIAIQLAAGLLGGSARAHTTDSYQWANVPIGGGGAIPNFIFHPKVANLMYIGADVGGLDRWDQPTQQWIPLLDWLRRDEFNMYGVEGVAVDPSDTTGNIVYVGTGYANWATKGELMKSTDRGTTWIRNGVKITGNSNGDQGNSERIAVDPNNGQVVYYASQDGLFRTTDGNTTLALLAGAPTGNTSMIVIDKTSGTVTGPTRTKRIYLQPPTGALNVSNDGGNTWSAISGAPSGVNKAVISSTGILYCTGSGGVWKDSGGTWTNISPVSTNYSCIDIDPNNDNNLVVAESGGHGVRSWRSSNAGAGWAQISYTASSNPGWLLNAPDSADSSIFNMKFNPFASGEVWITDWYSPWKTTNIWAATVAYSSVVTGHEETVQQPSLISPPSGATFLYSGVADVNGFAIRSLTYPNFPIQIRFPTWFNINGGDFEEANPSFAAFVGISGWSGAGAGGYTTDAGSTYTQFPSLPATTNNGGRIAITATSGRILWATGNGNVYYSDNKGSSWTQSNGAPGSLVVNQLFNYFTPLATDRINNNKAYIYSGGTIWRSTDGGANFSVVKTGLPSQYDGHLFVNFTTEGDLWLALTDNGLWHSTDSGTTWTQLSNVQSALLGSFGKGPSTGTSSLYIMGKVDGDTTEGIFRSDDQGATWAKIDIANPYPGDQANTICGDRQTYGQVYVGSQIGILYGKKGAGAPPAPSGLTATAGNTQATLAWTASTGATSYNVYRGTTAGGESGTAIATGIATVTYTNTGLTNGTNYFYYVKAVNTLGTSAASNEASAQPFAPVPQAQIATGTALIDGAVDAAWSNATSYPLTKTTGTITNGADCSGSWQGMWDATNLYILVNVTDDVKKNDSTNPWDDDAVEIYLDADHNGGTTYDANDRQIVCGWGDAAPVEGGGRAIAGAAFATADPTGTTYRIEAKIPWAVEAFTPAANAIIGIDVHIDDDDDGAARDGKVIWNDGTDQAWQNPSLFGTGKLIANAAPPVPTGLAATPGNAQVALTWNASSGATSYNVKRSTVSGSGYVTVSSPTVTNYTNTGLTNGTTYYYVVSAVNANGESANSSQVSATPVAPPAAPTGLTAVPGIAQVWLTWTASGGATTYNVKRSTVSGSGYATAGSPATTYFMNTGLTNGTTYYFVVTAVNAGGESANSTQASAAPSATVPQAQIASGTATIDGNVDAAWNSATSYLVSKTGGTINSYSDCTATFKGMWDATNLYVLVDVTDDVKTNDSVNAYDDDCVEVYLDADHNGGTVYDANDRQVLFGWGDAAPVEGAGRSITGAAFAKADPTGTSYRIEAKIPWAIEAFTPTSNAIVGIDVMVDDDDDGGARDGKLLWNDGTDQAWTNPSVFGAGKLTGGVSIPAAPTGLTATPGNTQAALSWTASTGATSYNVKRSTVSGSGYVTVSSPATTSYTNTGLTNGTTYYFVVTAVNSAGESGNSNQASAIPISPNVHTGTWALKGILTGTPSHGFCAQITGASPSQTYVASLWIKGTGSVNLHVYHGSWGAELPVTQCTASGSWQQITTAPFSTGTDTNVTFSIQDDFNTAGTVYIDDAFIGVANGTNMLVNPGLESGNTTWSVNAPFSIVQNP